MSGSGSSTISDVNHEMDVERHGWGPPTVQPVMPPKVHCQREGCCISSQPFFFLAVVLYYFVVLAKYREA